MAELFVVLDNVKFRKNYFQNRNLLKTKSGTDDWFTVPVEKDADKKLIKDVLASTDPNWRRKVLRKIEENLKVDMSEVYHHDHLVDINVASIKWCMSELGMDRRMVFASELGVEGSKSELLANILRKVGATKYISGPSGKDYLDMSLFEGIEVEFFQPKVDNHYSTLWNLASFRTHGQVLRI